MADAPPAVNLADFLTQHPGDPDDSIAYWVNGQITLGELAEAAERIARLLRAGHVTPGRPIATLVESGASTLAAMFGTWIAGAAFIPVNGRLTDAEIRHQLSSTNAGAVIGRAGRAVGLEDHWIAETGALEWSPAAAGVAGGESAGDDVALVMWTSGTTGAPKPIVLTHQGVAEGIDTVMASLRSKRRDPDRPPPAPMPNLIPSSLALWAGSWNALFALRAGAPIVLMDRFTSGDYATLVQRHAIRSTVLAPAMMTMLVEDEAVTDLTPLSMVRSISSPLTPAQARAFRAKFGVGVMNCYGQTELGSEVVGWTPSDLKTYGEDKLGAVGRPHDRVEIRVLDPDGDAVATGTSGEIWIHSPFMSNAPDIAARVVDGFLRTGDLGYVDADGFLWLEGRVSDLINRGGLKVVPQEVEDVLRQLPEVADACVAGVPDERLGEVPMAWVRAVPGYFPDVAALLEGARERLAAYKVPIGIELVDDLPRNEVGKVVRQDLVARWTSTNGRAGGRL